MNDDQGWDFNAPQFVDFAGGNSFQDDDNADEYFDYDHENGIPVQLENDDTMDGTVTCDVFSTPESAVKRVTRSNAATPVTASNPTPEIKKVKENLTPQSQPIPLRSTRSTAKKAQASDETANRQQVKKKPDNICTNLDEWRKKTTKVASNQSRKEAAPAKKEPENKSNQKRHHRSLERSDSLPKRQKPAVPERGRTPSKSQPGAVHRSSSFSNLHNKNGDSAKKKHERGYSGGRALRARSGSASSDKSENEKQKSGLTVPSTPTFMKRKPVKLISQPPVKNSEQMEMDKITFYRQELAKKRKLAQESCKTALSVKGPTSTLATKEPTKPHEFHFQTDSRIKVHGMETRQDGDTKDFADILRSDKGHQTTKTHKNGPTKPEPFSFASQRKRKLPDMDEKQAEKYETMAEKLKAYTATPDRFKSNPKVPPRARSRSPPHGITMPKTPQFETRTRSRPVTAPSRQDLEQKELEEIQRCQFKAKPVNPKIFNSSNVGIKKVASKPTTVPEAFHLSHDKKAANREHGKDREEHYEFHAQPFNKKIIEGTVGLKEAKKIPVTVPESPAFALKHRARIPVEVEEQEEKQSSRPRAMPHFGIPFQPQLHHKITEPEPFGFEERDKKRHAMKAQKIEQVYEEEIRQREFHANPLPSLETHLPPKKSRPLTAHQPFNLDTETRGMKKANEWSQKLEEELRQQKEKARFKAKEPRVLEKEPFIPAKENKYTTDISEFELSTAKRVLKREAFEMHKKVKQDQIDDIRHQEQLMKEAEEKAELERLRQEAVHKANPVKQYRKMNIRRSEKPLTEPNTPKFKTDTRLRQRAMHADSSIMST